MAPETLIFMPNGDVTLTLTRHILEKEEPETGIEDETTQNAPAFEPEVAAEPEELEEDDALFFAPDAPDSETFYPPTRRAHGSDASSRRDRSTSPPASFWAQLKREQAKMGEPAEVEKPATEVKPAKKERIVLSSHEVHCIVSSRHMMLASRYFEGLLGGNSKEATMLRSKKHVSIPLSADLDAMIVLLNIVHGVSRKVPRQVKLDTLSKLAMLVRVFGMIDAVQFFSDTWIDDFQKKGLPQTYDGEVLSLLFVFWVFDRPDEFRNMTRIVQRECDENLDEDALEVPIPRSILDAIKRDREFAMESAIAMIHTLINKYLDGHNVCDGAWEEEYAYACDATVLGSLMKSSRMIGIWPKPEAPFVGKKFKTLAQAIRGIKILDVCKKSSSRRLHLLGPSNNSHGLEDSIEAAMKGIEAGMDGLALTEYVKSDDLGSMFLPAQPDEVVEEPPIEIIHEDVPLYMREKVEAPRREYSVSPPAVSARPISRDAEVVAPKDTPTVSTRQSRESVETEVFAPTINGYHETSSRRKSRESVEAEVAAPARDSLLETRESVKQDMYGSVRINHEKSEPMFQDGYAKSRTSKIPEAKKTVHTTERASSRESWKQETDESDHPTKERIESIPINSWSEQSKDPLQAQRRSSSTDSRIRDMKAQTIEQATAGSRNSWHFEAEESVIEQRKPSPSDSWNMRTPSNGVARSSVESSNYKNEETRAYPEGRQSANGNYQRDVLKQESQPVPRNSSAERVKTLADKSLHRTPSFHKIAPEEVKPQQAVVPSRKNSPEEVRVLPDQRSSTITAYSKNAPRPNVQTAPMVQKAPSHEPVRVLNERKSNSMNPFMNSSKNDAKSPLSQPPMTPSIMTLGDTANEDRKSYPFTQMPKTGNDTSIAASPSTTTPRVPSREEVAALTNKKLNTTSFFQVHSKEEVKFTIQPAQPASRTNSSEEVAKIMTTPQLSVVSRGEKEDVKPTIEVRATTNDALSPAEDEEAALAPQKFNMRKSKKKFQAKY